MNRYSLYFHDSVLERKYQAETEPKRIQSLFSLLIIEILLTSFSVMYFSLKNARYSLFFTIPVLFALGVLFFLIKRYFAKFLKLCLIVLFFGISVLATETVNVHRNKSSFFVENAIASTALAQLYTYAIFLTRTSWLFCTAFYALGLGYMYGRLFDFHNWDDKDSILMVLAFSIFFFGYMTYTQEKTLREFYKSIHESGQSLSQFKILAQNIIPNPIFVIDYGKSKVEFLNSSAFEMLDIETVSEIIRVDEKILENNLNKLNEDFENTPGKRVIENNDKFNKDSDFFSNNNQTIPNSLFNKKKMNQNDNKRVTISDYSKNIDNNNTPFSSFEKLISSFKVDDACVDPISLSQTLLDFSKGIPNHPFNISDDPKTYKDQIHFKTINIIIEDPNSPNSKLYFELKIGKIFWENRSCLLLLLTNNTNLRKLIELQNLDEYKNRLLATVSHDLRTPLHGMIGIFETVIPRITDPEINKNLTIGLRSGNLLLYMINDILDFSQMIYKKIRLNLELVKIQDLIEETAELIEFQVKKKGLQFIVSVKDFNKKILYTDANRIKQILLNLLSNSLKFTFNGFIKLTIKDCSNKFKCQTYKLSVKDSGIGIKDIDKSKLFKLFGKLEQSDRNINKTGVGLGLTISQGLASMLYKSPLEGQKGGIHMKSEYGSGSKFWFYVQSIEEEGENVFSTQDFLKINHPFSKTYSNKKIPNKLLSTKNFYSKCHTSESMLCLTSNKNYFSKEKITKDKVYSREIQEDTQNIENKSCRIEKAEEFSCNNVIFEKKERRVLIVDDDLINLMIGQKYMEYFGLKYLTANNGEEAFQMVRNDVITHRNEIALVLMDCNMPILDGFKASRKILDFLSQEGAQEIPIIAVTANIEVAEEIKCFEAGMKKFLTKPVKRKDMEIVLQNFLKI